MNHNYERVKAMKKNGMWSLKINTASLVLIPAAVGINYLGKLFASALKLPLWLDSIGTMLSALLAGPVVGAVCGALNNIIYGFQDPISFVYAVTSAGIGVAAGVLGYKGWFGSLGRAIVSSLIIGAVAVVISTPLNVIFWGGQTGNIWGDAVYAAAAAGGMPMFISSLLDEVVVDFPDKLVTVLIVFGIYKALPKRLALLFSNSETVEKLD